MPRFQNKKILKELIRGFIRIPESRNINKFLNILKNSRKNSLNLPAGKYLLQPQDILENYSGKLSLNFGNLKLVEKELRELDDKFEMPPVLKPYLRFCEISYENYSIAKNYNGIMQLLFSGRSEDITETQRRFLEKYNS